MSARSLCERRHGPVALREAETGLYDTHRQTVVVISQQRSALAKATCYEALTDMLCFPARGVRLTSYAAVHDSLGAGYDLRLARESGIVSVYEFHLDVTDPVRLAIDSVSDAEVSSHLAGEH